MTELKKKTQLGKGTHYLSREIDIEEKLFWVKISCMVFKWKSKSLNRDLVQTQSRARVIIQRACLEIQVRVLSSTLADILNNASREILNSTWYDHPHSHLSLKKISYFLISPRNILPPTKWLKLKYLSTICYRRMIIFSISRCCVQGWVKNISVSNMLGKKVGITATLPKWYIIIDDR